MEEVVEPQINKIINIRKEIKQLKKITKVKVVKPVYRNPPVSIRNTMRQRITFRKLDKFYKKSQYIKLKTKSSRKIQGFFFKGTFQ